MMDAISFVLGVKSSHLRSQNMKDLIYRGRINGGDHSEIPTRAHVMATYQKDNGELVHLKRSITSNGSSEYKINEVSVTALNYSLVLKAENILIKARNFLVFQGDVEQIASQSAKDLTDMIETISGSNEFSKEHDQLKDELEKAHEFSNSVFSRKRTLNSESKQYKEQMAEQREFEQKLYEKSETIKKINLYKLFHNQKKHFESIEELSSKKKQLKETEKKLASENKSLKNAVAEYSKLVLENKKHSTSIEQVSTKVELSKRDLIPIEANKKAFATKVSQIKNKVNEIEIDYNRQKKQVVQIEKQLKEAEKLYLEFQDKIRASVSSSMTAEGQREYEILRSKFLANDGSRLEEEITILNNDKDSLKTGVSNLKVQSSNASSRISELEGIVNSELKSKLSDITNDINDVLTLKQEKTETRAALIKSKEEFVYQELQLNSKLRDVLVRLDELSSQQRESNKQRKLRENVAMLKKFFPKGSIKGLVYELVRPSQQKYELALQTVLGRNFDSIIVQSTSVAYKCIEILKERRTGVATFIPLDSVVNDPINLNFLRSIDSAAQPGVDILQYDDKSLEQAINYVVGNALVIDGIEKARELKWSSHRLDCKMVTLDGSVIHKSGLMTGGQAQTSSSITWDKNEWNSLNEVRDEITGQLSKLQETKPKELEINVIAEEISLLDDKLPMLRNQKLNVERVTKDRQREIGHQAELLQKFEDQIKDKQLAIVELDKEILNFQTQITTLQERTYSEFCIKYKFSNGIEDYENLHGSTLRVRTKERAQFSKAISTLTNKLNFENQRVKETEERRKSVEKHLEDLEQERLIILAQKQELEDIIDRDEAELEILQIEEVQNIVKSEGKLKYTKSLEARAKEIEAEISEITKSITNSEENLLKVDIERVNLLKNCKIGNVNIPLVDGLIESLPIDSFVKDVYDIEIDYDILDEKYLDEYSNRLEAELQVQLETVTDQLDKITPNAKAVERLKEVEVKIREFDKEHTVARQKERKIAAKAQVVRTKRYELFMQAFEHISGQIDFIYKELTKSNTSPLGGSAYLTLEDEDSPYSSGIKYHAMPPMKRFRDMELLSGGEKTIAALALLFAIHSFQPSPFFVLDEVDAALDNANVARIANYIKTHAGPSFQFIVISLKNSLFEKSDALVGIYREQRENSSRTVTLDLRDYPEEDIPVTVV